MKNLVLISALVVSTLASAAAMAAKSYQVTGTVVDVTDALITVDKKGEKFEITRTPAAKVAGEIKKGGKVTVYYSMTATEIEAKAEGKKK